MKLSFIALTTLYSTASAFVPVKPTGTSSPALYAMDGEEIRAARIGFAPGHFTTIGGGNGNGGRTVMDGEEIRKARTSYAPGMFNPHSSTGAVGNLPALAGAPATGAPKKSYGLGGGRSSWK